MLTQTEQDTSLQHPAPLSQPVVFRPQGSRDNITETLTGPNTRLSTCHHMECARWHMLERDPRHTKQEASPSPLYWPCHARHGQSVHSFIHTL